MKISADGRSFGSGRGGWGKLGVILLAGWMGLGAAWAGEALVRVTAGDVAEHLRKDGVMVCFEEAAGEGELSAKDIVAEIKAIPEAERTKAEKARLFTLEAMQQKTPEVTVRLPKLRKFTFDYVKPAKEPKAVLDALVAADPAYAWKQVGPRYVVYPRKGSRLDRPVAAFNVEGASYPALLGALNAEVFSRWQVSCTGVFPASPTIKRQTYTLHLGATTGWPLLQAVLDQLGPNLVWVEQSSVDDRSLYFTKVARRSGASAGD